MHCQCVFIVFCLQFIQTRSAATEERGTFGSNFLPCMRTAYAVCSDQWCGKPRRLRRGRIAPPAEADSSPPKVGSCVLIQCMLYICMVVVKTKPIPRAGRARSSLWRGRKARSNSGNLDELGTLRVSGSQPLSRNPFPSGKVGRQPRASRHRVRRNQRFPRRTCCGLVLSLKQNSRGRQLRRESNYFGFLSSVSSPVFGRFGSLPSRLLPSRLSPSRLSLSRS